MQITPTELPGVLLVRPVLHRDGRGVFTEIFRQDRLAAAGVTGPFVQDNLATSHAAGTVRGLHFQAPPAAQGKLVFCLAGRIFDVVVDIRRGSPCHGRHAGFLLDREEGAGLWVPPGLAHGYMTMAPDTTVLYKTTATYAPALEGGLCHDDPALGIDWPLPPEQRHLSPRDRGWPGIGSLASPFVMAPET